MKIPVAIWKKKKRGEDYGTQGYRAKPKSTKTRRKAKKKHNVYSFLQMSRVG